MSHTPDQPHEVPFREVEHDEAQDRFDVDGRDMIGGIGTVRDWDWWGSKTDDDRLRAELAERERSRARLGGFGFRGVAA